MIVGAGPVGSTLASLLGHAGVDCCILDTGGNTLDKTDNNIDPRALAITHASKRIMQSFDLWRHLPTERIGYFQNMHVWDENSQGEVAFSCRDMCESTLGYIIEQSVIQTELNKMLTVLPTVDVYSDVSVIDLSEEDGGIIVALEDGRRLKSQLLVAADGSHSTIRELAGIDYKTHDYAQQAVACVVNTFLSHAHVARQRFLSLGPLAFLPMYAENQCAIVWSTAPEHARQLMNLEDEQFRTELQNAFESTLGDITGSGPRAVFPLRRAQAERYCLSRIALVGDAAHCVHPLAGQGANLGLLDAASLFEVLYEARLKKKDVGRLSVLRRYERWRKGENHLMMMVFEAFKYLFESQKTPLPLLRETGMKLFNNMEPIKQQVMRRAMGLEGDLPEIARAL